ncbi:MAG: SGNH/GDSL hydrolase family protein [Planctomycetota bacterium]
MLFKKNQKIVFFGDSLTQRTGVVLNPYPARRYTVDYRESYVDILVKRILVNFPETPVEIFNKGIGGNKTTDLLARIEDDVLSIKPDHVVMMIGTNDTKKLSADEYRENLEKIISTFQKNSINVIQLTVLPGAKLERDDIKSEFNSIIYSLQEKYNHLVIDGAAAFKKVFAANEANKHEMNLYVDGAHLSELGNILLADTVYKVITEES